jgi:tetratricopeptide (TPR) repeat protein
MQRLDGVVSTTSSDAAAINLRGVAEMMSGRLDPALRSFDAAIARDGSLLDPRFNRGVALLKKEAWDEAAAAFGYVYGRAGSLQASAAYHRGLAEEGAGRLSAAAEWFGKALAADPNLDDAMVGLGVVREKLGQYEGAGQAYKNYLARHPDSVVATLRFGVVAHAAGHSDLAAVYLRKVMAAAPGTPEAAEAAKFLVMWE